jgi:hypothetical protein
MSRQQMIGLSIWTSLAILAASLEDRSGFLLHFLLPLSLTVNVLFIVTWAYGVRRLRRAQQRFDDILDGMP